MRGHKKIWHVVSLGVRYIIWENTETQSDRKYYVTDFFGRTCRHPSFVFNWYFDSIEDAKRHTRWHAGLFP